MSLKNNFIKLETLITSKVMEKSRRARRLFKSRKKTKLREIVRDEIRDLRRR